MGIKQAAARAGFSKEVFASIERFDIRIKIVPLLLKRLEIDELVVHQLAVDFEINAAGENNWSDLFGRSGRPKTESGLNGILIGGIEVTDSRLSWLDVYSGKHFNLSSMNVTTEAFVEGQPLPLTFKAYIESNQPEWAAATFVKTKLAFDPGSPIFDAKELRLVIKAKLPIEKMDPVTFTLGADSQVNVKTKTARLEGTRFSFLDLVMSGSFDVENIFSTPTIYGPLKVKAFEAQALAKHFKVELPELANSLSLKNIALTANFKTDFDSIHLDDLSAKFDSTKINGFVRAEKLSDATPVVRYDLDVDKVVWDDYAFASDESKLHLPLGFIRAVDLEGSLDVATVMVDDLSVISLQVPADIKQGILTSNPISMEIKDAGIKAAMQLNATAAPVARTTIEINNMNTMDSINPLFKKIMGEKPLLVEGIVTASADLKSSGESIHAHRSSVKGTLDVNMDNLVLQGVDLNHASKKVVAEYANKHNFKTRKSYVPEYVPDLKNNFTSLRAVFKVSGKKLSTTDILLVSDAANITGAGSIDFQKNTLSSRPVIDIHVKNRIDIRDKLRDHPMGYHVQGPFENLTTQFDIDRYELLVGRLLIQEAKARRNKALNTKKTW